jgi:soluble lytic murein transglycosylase-like protein
MPRFVAVAHIALAAIAVLVAIVVTQANVWRPSMDVPVAFTIQDESARAGDLVIARKTVSVALVAERVPAQLDASHRRTIAPAAVIAGTEMTTMDYQAIAAAAAQKYGLDPAIFARQITQESHWNPTIVSSAGAVGIAQIMPDTAKWWGVDPLDPIASLDAAAKADRNALDLYGGDWRLVLAAYNAGPGAVAKYGGVPPYSQTENYIRLILADAPTETIISFPAEQEPDPRRVGGRILAG